MGIAPWPTGAAAFDTASVYAIYHGSHRPCPANDISQSDATHGKRNRATADSAAAGNENAKKRIQPTTTTPSWSQASTNKCTTGEHGRTSSWSIIQAARYYYTNWFKRQHSRHGQSASIYSANERCHKLGFPASRRHWFRCTTSIGSTATSITEITAGSKVRRCPTKKQSAFQDRSTAAPGRCCRTIERRERPTARGCAHTLLPLALPSYGWRSNQRHLS